jgi:signal transduction histidine kinase
VTSGVAVQVARDGFTLVAQTAARATVTTPGVGLGLALSRRLARSQGGDLRLGEEMDQGEGLCSSCF